MEHSPDRPHAVRHTLYRLLLLIMGLAILAWSAMVFTERHYKSKHASLHDLIQTGAVPPQELQSALTQAIADYQTLSSLFPCYRRSDHTLALFQLAAAEFHLTAGDMEQSSGYLSDARESLNRHLGCEPLDAKAWLDYSLVLAEEQGFTDEALQAWKRAAVIAPHEAWLVEERLLLALRFNPLLDDEALQWVERDIATLQKALLRRRNLFLKKTGFQSFEALQDWFNHPVDMQDLKVPELSSK